MSIFDGVDFSFLECTQAQKTISGSWGNKHIITRLEFADHTGNIVFSARASYVLNEDRQIDESEGIKVSSDNHKENKQLRLRSFSKSEVSKELKKDIDIMDKLFDNANQDVKRVY